MALFLNNAGLLIETDDIIKIECFRAKGLKEIVEEPHPVQEVEVEDEYTVKPAKKKGKKGA